MVAMMVAMGVQNYCKKLRRVPNFAPRARAALVAWPGSIESINRIEPGYIGVCFVRLIKVITPCQTLLHSGLN